MSRLTSASKRQPGTASRLTTGARPGTKGGFSNSSLLSQPFKVEDRLITQQGLGGPKTAKGSRRQIEDKNYYLGLLRGKINEITKELHSLNRQMVEAKDESESYIQYEQMAEKLALEIKNLQGELGDYNTLVDKMNTNDDIKSLEMDFEDIKANNEKSEKMLEHLFEEKKTKESHLNSLEIELEQERRMTESLVTNMPLEMRNRYEQAKEENQHYLKKMTQLQEDLDTLNVKKFDLEQELEQSYIKQQAMKMYNELSEVEMKRNQLLEEEKARGDPQQERERLLKQVKEDNLETVAIERQINESQDRLEILQDELLVIERDIEDNQGEKMQKYRDLKKREEQMDDFLANYEHTTDLEQNKLENMETEITALLEKLSRNMSRMGHVPTENELRQVQDQLSFKSSEVSKSEQTAASLSMERTKLAQDLAKIDQMQDKITVERQTLKEKITQMKSDIEKFSDLEKVKDESDTLKHRLMDEKERLTRRRDYMRRVTQGFARQYENEKVKLDEDETQTQLVNLEKKWQNLEQNNYVMREFISTKSLESDYITLSNNVKKFLDDMNSELKENLEGKSTLG